jgi:hypothetical protein
VKLDVGPEGSIELSLVIYDKSDTQLVMIDRNEWKAGDPSLWDLESDYQYLKIRSKPYDVLLEINAQKEPLRVRAQLWYRGTRIDCKPSRILMSTPTIGDLVIRGGTLSGYQIATSADGKSTGIIPMNIHPDDPFFGANAGRKKEE